jgi:hypothetical protein
MPEFMPFDRNTYEAYNQITCIQKKMLHEIWKPEEQCSIHHVSVVDHLYCQVIWSYIYDYDVIV